MRGVIENNARMASSPVKDRSNLAFLAQPMVIVAVTGWGQPQDRDRAMEAGFDAHLTKPVDPLVLGQLLSSLAR